MFGKERQMRRTSNDLCGDFSSKFEICLDPRILVNADNDWLSWTSKKFIATRFARTGSRNFSKMRALRHVFINFQSSRFVFVKA